MGAVMRVLWVCLALLSVAALGCDDDAKSGQGGVDNNAPNNANNDTNNDQPDADIDEPDADLPDGDDDEPDVPEGECESGQRECNAELGRRVCGPDLNWLEDPCPEDFTCEGQGECRADEAPCPEGQRVCISDSEPGICAQGGQVVALDPCDPEQACVDGTCRSRRCAEAARNASYLGCDYMAVDLPNVAFSDLGGTPAAPLGVVLTNPNELEPVTFSVFSPDGQVAELVSQAVISPPPVVFGQYPPVTVQTEIRDIDGQVVISAFPRANQIQIPPGGMAAILLPHVPYFERTQILRQAHYIRTDSPVAAYQFGPYCCNFSFSNDASLLFPISALGTEYLYLGVPSWGIVDDDGEGGQELTTIPTVMSIVGTRAQTSVFVELPPGVQVIPDSTGNVRIQGQQVTATLNSNEVLHLFGQPATVVRGVPTGTDLSGARISASSPVAVFSGHLCSFYPREFSACDHLEEQLFPTNTWGQEFSLVPPIARAPNQSSSQEAVYWKIIARDADTELEFTTPLGDLDPRVPGFENVPNCLERLDGTGTRLTLGSGQFCEFGTLEAVNVRANKPIMIMGIFSGQGSTGIAMPFGAHAGDPAIFLVPPKRQYRDSYAFLAPTTYFGDYLTVITRPEASIMLDGEAVDLSDATPIPGSTDIYKHIQIDDGPHEVVSNFPFGILTYAFDDYVSYAFTGGLNLIKR
mgnify:CR=1 FL=1